MVVLGVSGIKPAGEGVFGYFDRGELETTDLGSGIGVHSSLYPYFDGFQSLGVGVLLALGGHELAPVRNRVGQPLHGTLRTHHLAERGVRAELSSASAGPYLPQDRGYQWGRGGERPPSLGASPMWPHGSISQFRCSPLCEGDCFKGRMQDGTITTESSHGRMGSVGRTPVGCHSGLGTGVHTLQSRSIYSYSRVLSHGRAQWIVGSHVLGFLPSPIDECMVSHDCSQLEERGSIYLVDTIAIIEVRGEEVLTSTGP
jgi:hypothetical protein